MKINKKVIIVGPEENIFRVRMGSMYKLTFNLIKYLMHNGIDVYYIGVTDKNNLGGLSRYLHNYVAFSLKLRKSIEKILGDDLIIHSLNFYNLMFFNIHRYPLIISEFNHYPWIKEYLYYPTLSADERIRWDIDFNFRIQTARMILPRATAITAVSKYQADKMNYYVPAIRNKLKIIPNAVDTNFYKPQPDFKLKEKILEDAEILATYSGRLVPHKGLHLLFEALARVDKNARKKIKILITGPKASLFGAREKKGKYINLLNHILEKYNLKNIVTFAGIVPENQMPKYYSISDFLIHPSLVEAFGLSIVEAMSCGTPVVAFDLPPINEIVNPQVGLLAKISIADLAQKIQEMIINDKLRKRLSMNTREYVLDRYSWENVIKMYIKLYRDV
jgi:glycosyltransferase involved in cell wall biosynthesis